MQLEYANYIPYERFLPNNYRTWCNNIEHKKAIILKKISTHSPTFISTSIPRDEINRTKKKSLGSHRS